MNCTHCLAHVDDVLDGQLPAETQAAVLAHLADCPHCRRQLAAQRQLLQALRQLPAPGTPPGLATRVLPGLRVGRRQRHALAAAAALLLGLSLAFTRPDPATTPVPDLSATGVPDRPTPVRLVLRSDTAVRAVTIELALPEGTRLAHTQHGTRPLRWQADLAAGPNLLELPLVFERPDVDGVLIARVSIDGSARQFRVPVRSPDRLSPGAQAPRPAGTGGPVPGEASRHV